jgi:protein-S-isoprenylcysteine O-methyltransferase Ste14
MNNSNQDIETESEALSIREQSMLHWESLSKQPVIFSWTTQREDKDGKILSYSLLSITAIIALLLCIFLDDDLDGKYAVPSMVIIAGLFVFCGSYFWGAADDYYEYNLTQQGIYYTHTQLVPEIVFKFVRGFSYFGILVCIVAGVILGPVIFFGAGVFALMSFGMTNIEQKTNKRCLTFRESYKLCYAKDDGVIGLLQIPRRGLYSGRIYCDDSMKLTLIEWFKNNLVITDENISKDQYDLFDKYHQKNNEQSN